MKVSERLATVADLGLEVTIVGSFTAVGYGARQRLFGWAGPTAEEAEGKVVVVTGATSGLGRAAAARFAELGCRVVAVGRDPDKAAALAEELTRLSPHGLVDVHTADLARFEDVDRLLAELKGLARIDALVHNAGALTHRHVETDDGLELTHQTHVVSPFRLTQGLLPILQATPGSRVITMSSGGMYTQALLADPQLPAQDYDGVRAYALAKRAQVVLNQEWARRHPDGPAFHAMHPGWADTPGVVTSLPTFHRVTRRWLRTPDQGADTMVWLALVAEVPAPSGSFWLDRRPRGISYRPSTRHTPEQASDLWERVAGQALAKAA